MSEKNVGRYHSEPLDLRFFLILIIIFEEDQLVIEVILYDKLVYLFTSNKELSVLRIILNYKVLENLRILL